jgi:hypothetical protein
VADYTFTFTRLFGDPNWHGTYGREARVLVHNALGLHTAARRLVDEAFEPVGRQCRTRGRQRRGCRYRSPYPTPEGIIWMGLTVGLTDCPMRTPAILREVVRAADPRRSLADLWTAGRSRPIRMAMIAIATSNSTNADPLRGAIEMSVFRAPMCGIALMRPWC